MTIVHEPHLRVVTYTEVEKGLRERDLAWLKGEIERIACFDDRGANEHLARSGSYGRFDEPGSVRIAREILAEWSEIFPA